MRQRTETFSYDDRIVRMFALATFVWVPALRSPTVLAGVALHALMEVFLNLQLFGITMIVCLTLFVEPRFLDTLLAGLEPAWLGLSGGR